MVKKSYKEDLDIEDVDDITDTEHVDIDRQKKTLTFFLLFFPTLLVIVVGILMGVVINFKVVGVQLLIAFLQLVTLKNFIDTTYR